MKDTITATGIVLSTMPIGEYDKRLLIETRECGKISVFARGARRPNSPLMGAAVLFAFGEFELAEGRSAYTLRSARVTEHFDWITQDIEAMCYGSYFAEITDYYGKENIDGSEAIKLLFFALRALHNDKLSRPLIRRVFELKAMQLEGEYFEAPRTEVPEPALKAWRYVLDTHQEKLFRFVLDPEAEKAFGRAVEQMKQTFIDRSFRSLTVLEETLELLKGTGE
ncbi:MAG: DNA repair protein RecO [Lachnospiraceae bacterium]|nr:DNA repair protein RecO [Lachnospiraceae bacterium]MBQ6195906.1 DNA repair protein RecO [Lachnospiraceae bacterium]